MSNQSSPSTSKAPQISISIPSSRSSLLPLINYSTDSNSNSNNSTTLNSSPSSNNKPLPQAPNPSTKVYGNSRLREDDRNEDGNRKGKGRMEIEREANQTSTISVHSFPPSNSSYSQQSTTSPQSMSAIVLAAIPTKSPKSKPISIPFQSSIPRPRLHSNHSSIAPASIKNRDENLVNDKDIVFGSKPLGIIGKHKPREIIRVERDYSMGSELCQFWSGWIWELEGRISPTDYQTTLNELNTILASAHDPYLSSFDNCLAILTLYLSPMIISTHYKKEMIKFDKLIHRVNRDLFNPSGLHLLSPSKVAFLFLEIEYY